jgi:hypothetical protein
MERKRRHFPLFRAFLKSEKNDLVCLPYAAFRGDARTKNIDWSGSENTVVLDFIDFPPFPQKKAERMGHGSLWQKQK